MIMEHGEDTAPHLLDASKRLAHQALVVAENRAQLFLLEMQEERDRISRSFFLSLGIAVLVLLAGMALTALIVVACWQWSPVIPLLILVLIYSGIAGFFYMQLAQIRR